MLILTRRTGESIKIDDDITVKLLNIERGVVSIGIDAPRNIQIVREELYKNWIPNFTDFEEEEDARYG